MLHQMVEISCQSVSNRVEQWPWALAATRLPRHACHGSSDTHTKEKGSSTK